MAVTSQEDDMKKTMEKAKLEQKTKDFNLCKAIAKILEEDGPQRVYLVGEAGIGKTRLAKMVGEHVIENGRCFLTLCVHLNKKFVDELSLYKNIASQLCVYSDFEETEVDDRDEDEEEEKDDKALLTDLTKKITEEIEKKEEAGNNAKETGNKNPPASRKEKPAVAGTKPGEEEKKSTRKQYLLLILDDEGNKVTSEDKVTIEDKVTSKDEVNSEDKVTIKDEVTLEGKVTSVVEVTSEERVMKDLNLEKFLSKLHFLKDRSRLKILITKRKGDEEPTKSDEKTESVEEQEEGNNDNENESDGETKSEDNDNEGNEDNENESDGGIKSEDNENESGGEIKPEDNDNGGKPEPQATDNTQLKKPGRESGPPTGDEPSAVTKPYGEIESHTTDQSHVLLETINMAEPSKRYGEIEFHTTNVLLKIINVKELLESLITDDWNDAEWITKMVENSKNSPAAVVVLAKSLEQITPKTSGPEKIEEIRKIKEKIEEVLSADRPGSSSERTINPILHLAYILLEIYDDRLKEAILDCFWHSLDFFEHCGCVYYRDLITQWILEGYFDPVRSVEKAYQDGHLILMELIKRGMLKIQENNVVVPERAMSNLIDPRRRGLFGRSRLRFSGVYCGDKKKGLGKITQIDDMIKTVQAKKGDKMTTILVSGDRLRRVTPEKYFAKLDGLEVLGMFEPTLEPFVPALLKGVEKRAPLKTLDKLRVLVIRDCDLLDDIEGLKVLQELQALEVSGASSLKKISGDFFKAMPKLQSLHLSGLQIESSPHSISQLTELHCLIIKDCPLLKDLPDIQELVKLEVVDISGARGLQTCFDNTPGDKKNKSKNKNFYHLTKLQLLDFSESQIERLPIFQDSAEGKSLHSVTRLLLRNCSKLRRLPSLKPLSGLQILDLSGTTSLVEMLEVCFEEKKKLKSLNLSGTNLSELATTIEELSNLTELLLKNCTNLEAIPNITKLENLEVIDVSGSTKLAKIEVSFKEMLYLREVNLSGTKVETPELPNKSKIHGLKCITLADGTCFKGKDWNEVKAAMPSPRSEDASSSGAVVRSQEISEKESEDASSSGAVVRSEIQSNEPRTSDCSEKGDVTKERLLQVPIERTLYQTTQLFFDFASQQGVMEINETNEVDGEALANAEFVSFVDCSPTRLTSIFNKTKSVKGCWLRMCTGIKDLFSAVDGERLELLETLSITNLPLLETISCGGSFKNLRKLTIDCCPNIITLFPEASQLSSSLKDLHVDYCEKLEKVAEGVELSTFTNLKVKNCPKFEENSVGSDWVVVDHSDAPPQG